MATEDNEVLNALRSRGLTTTDILRLIQAASEAKSSSSSLWETAVPYLVSAAAGMAMYMLTEEMEIPEEPQLEEAGEEDPEEGPRETIREKNQTNEVLKALADLKREVSSLSAYVKELVAPPIIKDVDTFAKTHSDMPDLKTNNHLPIDFNIYVENLNLALQDIHQLNQANRTALVTGSAAMKMYISKLKSIPLQARYRKIYRNNAGFQNSVGKLQGYENLFSAIGFVSRDNGSYFEWTWSLSDEPSISTSSSSPMPSFEQAKYLIERSIDSLQTLSQGEPPIKFEVREFAPALVAKTDADTEEQKDTSDGVALDSIRQSLPSFNEVRQVICSFLLIIALDLASLF